MISVRKWLSGIGIIAAGATVLAVPSIGRADPEWIAQAAAVPVFSHQRGNHHDVARCSASVGSA